MKKIYVLIGNYGSGKTELAINFSLAAAQRGKTLLIDLDLLNPYFRLSERREIVEGAGVNIVIPNYASTNVESMSVSPEVFSAFDRDWDTVIFDVGGDITGATALGRFRRQFSGFAGELEVLYVANVRRPMSETPDKIKTLLQSLEQASRLKVTGFVNNTNLSGETGEDELPAGYEVLREVSEQTGVPVAYTSGTKELLEAFLNKNVDRKFVGAPFPLTRYMRRDWDSFTAKGI